MRQRTDGSCRQSSNADQQNALTIHLQAHHFTAPEVFYFGDLLKPHYRYPESTSNRSNASNPEHSVGHYLDLFSAIFGLTLFPLGYLLHAFTERQG